MTKQTGEERSLSLTSSPEQAARIENNLLAYTVSDLTSQIKLDCSERKFVEFSIVIPAHNEEGCIKSTIAALTGRLMEEALDYEIIVVNDNSSDGTRAILESLLCENERVRIIENTPPNGFGRAVQAGLDSMRGDAVAIVMADGSDSPEDIVSY